MGLVLNSLLPHFRNLVLSVRYLLLKLSRLVFEGSNLRSVCLFQINCLKLLSVLLLVILETIIAGRWASRQQQADRQEAAGNSLSLES